MELVGLHSHGLRSTNRSFSLKQSVAKKPEKTGLFWLSKADCLDTEAGVDNILGRLSEGFFKTESPDGLVVISLRASSF
jgi:hypothetical protein